MGKIATVGDLIMKLKEFPLDHIIAIEDGEYGPLLCEDGVGVYVEDARFPKSQDNVVVPAVVIGHSNGTV